MLAAFHKSKKVLFLMLLHLSGGCIVAAHAAGVDQNVPPPPRFEVSRYEVTGNSILNEVEMQRTLATYAGKDKDFSDVQRALEALQSMYQARGYGSVQVVLPEQALEQGTVKFVVIESKIVSIKIEGNAYFDESNIRRTVPALREGEPPNTREISANVRLANESAAKQLSVQLKGTEVEGDVEATLGVTESKPWRAVLSADNTGTRETGHFRIGAGYQYSNLFNLDHSLTMQYQTSPGHLNDVQIFGAAYHVPLYSLGDSLDMTLAISSVDSGTIQLAPGTGLGVSGQGTLYGARYNQNLPKHGDYEQKLSYGIDYRMYRPSITTGIVNLGNDLTLRPLSLTYSGQWNPKGQQLGFSLSAAANWSGAHNGGDRDFLKPLKDNYKLLRYGVDYSRALPMDWQLHLTLDGQMTGFKLATYEQFGLGGAQSVRGFHEREIASDKGLRGSAEIFTPDYGSTLGDKFNLRGLLFLDAGRAVFNHGVGAAEKREDIASFGAGIRVGFNKALSIRADYAQILDGIRNPTSGKTQTGDRFLHVGLGYLF